MATRKKKTNGGRRTDAVAKPNRGQAKCIRVADRGINTSKDFAEMMSVMIGDIATNRIEPRQANAICNASGKLLKVVEMQHKYGPKNGALELSPAPE